MLINTTYLGLIIESTCLYLNNPTQFYGPLFKIFIHRGCLCALLAASLALSSPYSHTHHWKKTFDFSSQPYHMLVFSSSHPEGKNIPISIFGYAAFIIIRIPHTKSALVPQRGETGAIGRWGRKWLRVVRCVRVQGSGLSFRRWLLELCSLWGCCLSGVDMGALIRAPSLILGFCGLRIVGWWLDQRGSGRYWGCNLRGWAFLLVCSGRRRSRWRSSKVWGWFSFNLKRLWGHFFWGGVQL